MEAPIRVMLAQPISVKEDPLNLQSQNRKRDDRAKAPSNSLEHPEPNLLSAWEVLPHLDIAQSRQRTADRRPGLPTRSGR
jgi:hypothetical protein